ncbi:UNVERIFIED_CONTAM: hypothetical protein PYX00_007926 [Menopon gallinae]|uniref:Uncharacterized protein n=1 Tax=Menopon gallinae TaxID=328185 RepID=A0AAW2HM71_9NEOP
MADIKFIDLKDTDSVEFHIYPDLSQSFKTGNVTFNLIDELMNDIYKIVGGLSENYIWHNEEFKIFPKNLVSCFESALNGPDPFCFYGSLNYGENVEDEWFLVYLLVELTKQIDGLVVQVRDGDGEILLIEAAEQLPSWITPETCEGKTFIYKGELHVLPLSYNAGNENSTVSHQVLKYVRENSETIKCDHSVQKAIGYKISGYPSKIEKNYHNAILYVPVGVASLLNTDEKLIAPAVRAFCDRDLIDIKACRAMRYFPPENRVYAKVKFTRLLYVMLATSKYIPDKRIGWNLPPPTDESYKSHLLGIKLACGFEILLNQAKGNSCKGESEESDFENDHNWKRFLNSLTARNYFKGLLEHSQQYNQLLDAAKEYYSNSCGKSLKPSRAKQVLDTFSKMDIDVEELKKRELSWSKSDDDSWMNITQEELDSLLKARFGCTGDKTGDDRFEIAHHLDEFINHVSDLEGAEFPNTQARII